MDTFARGHRPAQPDEKSLSIARHYIDMGQHARALDILDRAGDTSLVLPDYYFLRAGALHGLKRYEEGAGAARRGLELEPESIRLLYMLCVCEAELGCLADAERAILAALELAPESPALIVRYAHLAAQGGQLRKAEWLLGEAVRLAPDDAEVIRAQITLAYLRGDARRVEAHSRRLLAVEPADAWGHHMLGVAMDTTGRVRPAAYHLQSAAELEPEEEAMREAARQSRVGAHPLLWPLWPFGNWRRRIAFFLACSVMFAVVAFTISIEVAVVILPLLWSLMVYSWVVPPLLRLWLRWRRR